MDRKKRGERSGEKEKGERVYEKRGRLSKRERERKRDRETERQRQRERKCVIE